MQLSPKIQAEDLYDFFSTVGKVNEVKIIYDKYQRRSKGIEKRGNIQNSKIFQKFSKNFQKIFFFWTFFRFCTYENFDEEFLKFTERTVRVKFCARNLKIRNEGFFMQSTNRDQKWLLWQFDQIKKPKK